MSIIGHRGYSSKYRENTIEAFNQAIIHNFDGIELDINLTTDTNKYIIWHNSVSEKQIVESNTDFEKKEHIICYDDFVKYIGSEQFNNLIKNNISNRKCKFKILLDIKLNKKELKIFMIECFQKYFDKVKNKDNIITIIQTSIPNGFHKTHNKDKLRISYLYHGQTYEWWKSFFFGIDMSYIYGADEIMYDYKNLNILNIIIIKIQLAMFQVMGLPYKINFYTVNNKHIAALLRFLFSCSIISDDK